MPLLTKKPVVLSKTDNSNLKSLSSNKRDIEKQLQYQNESMKLHYDISSNTSSNITLTKKTIRLTVSSSDCANSKGKNEPQMKTNLLESVSNCIVDPSSSILDHSSEDMFGLLETWNSGYCLSPEQLNRPDIREKFIKFSQERGLEEELRSNFKILSQELLISETPTNDSQQNSALRCSLTPEEINRPGIKEKFIQFSQETGFEKELRNNFEVLSQKLRNSETLTNDSQQNSALSCSLTPEEINRPGIKEKFIKFSQETGFEKELRSKFEVLSQKLRNSGTKKNIKKENSKNKEIWQSKRGRPKKIVSETKKSQKKSLKKKSTKTTKLIPQEKKSLEEENRSIEEENTSPLEKENISLGEENTSLGEENTSLEEEYTSLEEENTSLEEENTLSLHEKMRFIHESRNVGLYVYCDSCDKARYLPDTKDPLELPEKWYCSMNPDQEHNKCSDTEEPIVDEELLIENKYNAGSIVWAKVNEYPWWPAMVEDDPYFEQYFLLEDTLVPTKYHVSFFDSHEVTVAWINNHKLKPFKLNINQLQFNNKKFNKFRIRVNVGIKQASEAGKLPLLDRLKTYSFINRYNFPNSKNQVLRKKKNFVQKDAGKKDLIIVNDERQKNKSIEKDQNGDKNTKLANKPTKSVFNDEEQNFSKKKYKKVLKLVSAEDLENSQDDIVIANNDGLNVYTELIIDYNTFH